MMNTKTTILVVAAVTAVLMVGCSSMVKKPLAPATEVRPALIIPSSFKSEEDKGEFARKAVVDGYYKEAVPLLEQSVAFTPSAESYRLLGTARFNLNDFSGAMAAWSRAAELNPALASEMQNNIGNALRDSRRVEEATAAYRKALELDSNRWTAAINLASTLRAKGELNEAIAVLEESAVVNKDVPAVHEFLAQLEMEAKSSTPSDNS